MNNKYYYNAKKVGEYEVEKILLLFSHSVPVRKMVKRLKNEFQIEISLTGLNTIINKLRKKIVEFNNDQFTVNNYEADLLQQINYVVNSQLVRSVDVLTKSDTEYFWIAIYKEKVMFNRMTKKLTKNINEILGNKESFTLQNNLEGLFIVYHCKFERIGSSKNKMTDSFLNFAQNEIKKYGQIPKVNFSLFVQEFIFKFNNKSPEMVYIRLVESLKSNPLK